MNLDEILQNVLCEENSAFFYTPSIYRRSRSYFFLSPVEVVEASNKKEVTGKLKRIDKLIKKGLTAYGYLAYDTGYLFEERLEHLCNDNSTLLKYCFYRKEDVQIFRPEGLEIGDWAEGSFGINSFKLNVSEDEYINTINKIKNYIAEGDTYQVNYTVKGNFNFFGNPASLFKKLIFNQSARYSAFINSGKDIIISLSPELFFSTKNQKIITKPMKGTARRGMNPGEDEKQFDSLKNSKKNKAENLMIVDLLRNDLGRISRYGSVKVKDLFEIEKYESLYQKISTVQARLRDNVRFPDIIKNIFPCGSITGAPKIRTMEIIKELEPEPRGIYTGAIGLLNITNRTGKSLAAKDLNKAVFNVAIRTIVVNKENGMGEIGIGSGIVWDSNPRKEYDETLLKSEFLLKPLPYFELFETMLIESNKVFLFKEHLMRLKFSADFFLFNYNEKKILQAVSKELKTLEKNRKYRLKLNLTKWGNIKLEIKDYPGIPDEIRITISSQKINSKNKFCFFKTSNRKLYDEEYLKYSEQGFFDVIFLNEQEQVCEGSITNIFIRKGNKWFTPSINCGLLPGVFRNYWLKMNPGIIEKKLFPDDLLNADEIILTNSLRKIIRVNKLYAYEYGVKQFQINKIADQTVI